MQKVKDIFESQQQRSSIRMKVNIGYLNCYDSILGLNLIKIFITPNIKCVFFSKNMARYRYGLIVHSISLDYHYFTSGYRTLWFYGLL